MPVDPLHFVGRHRSNFLPQRVEVRCECHQRQDEAGTGSRISIANFLSRFREVQIQFVVMEWAVLHRVFDQLSYYWGLAMRMVRSWNDDAT